MTLINKKIPLKIKAAKFLAAFLLNENNVQINHEFIPENSPGIFFKTNS